MSDFLANVRRYMGFVPRAAWLHTPIQLQRDLRARRAERRLAKAQLSIDLRDASEDTRGLVERAIEENQLRMRLALEASGAATWLVDYTRDGVESFDARSCELAGIDPRRPEWPPGTFCSLLHPEDRERMQAAAAETRASGRCAPLEYRIVRPDGQVRWLQGAGVVQRNRAGVVQRFIGVSIDITERKRLEGELRHTIEKLAAADRRKDDFIATLAHELRNPLAPIRSGVQILKLSLASADETSKRVTEMMNRQMNHLVRLIDDLLDASRITRGKLELHRTRVLLNEVLASVLESSRSLIEAQRLRVNVRIVDEPLAVQGDADRLTQVFSNLMSNAVKYTEDGGTIWLSLHREGNEAVVSVKDTGIGIPREALENIFEMFSQLPAQGRNEGGLGIGLALARQLLELHGGTVQARSDGPGRGSEFIVRLPALAATADVPRAQWNGSAQAPTQRRRRVLVVDDNYDAAASMAALLQMIGHEVHEAHDGLEAIEAVPSFDPDVILMDIGMPGIDGLEATRRIRALGQSRQPAIIAVTGWGQDGDRRRSQEAGIDHHLVKPVELDALRRLLN